MALPSFTVVGNLFEILGDVSESELVESPPTTLRLTFTPNISSVSTPVTYDGNLYKIGIVYGGIEDDGTIVHSSIVNGVNVTDGDPIQLLAQDAGLNVTGLMWKVSLEAPIADKTGWTLLMSWWIDAYADGATVDLSQVAPSVEAPANLNLVTYDLDTVTVVGEALITAPSELAAREAISAVSDFDFRLDDTRTPTDGSVTVDSFEATLGTYLDGIEGPYFEVASNKVINSNTDTTDTTKATIFGTGHYDSTEEPVIGVAVQATETGNFSRIGGGTAVGNAATRVEVWLASDTITPTGSRVAYFTPSALQLEDSVDITVGVNDGSEPKINLNAPSGTDRTIVYATNGVARWHLRCNTDSETGSDAGSNLVIENRDDSGDNLGSALEITRSDATATFSGTVVTPHGSSHQLSLPGMLLAPYAYTSGQYYFCNSQGNTSTGSTTNNTVRVTPWLVTESITISRMFAEFTVAGEAGSVFRFGIWNDDGTGKPGTLLLDAGTASTAGSPGAFEVTVSQAISPGIYWVGGAVQSAPSTAPTMRTVNSTTLPTAMPLGSSLPSTGSACSFIEGSVTGAFGTFSASPSVSSVAARIGFKVA